MLERILATLDESERAAIDEEEYVVLKAVADELPAVAR